MKKSLIITTVLMLLVFSGCAQGSERESNRTSAGVGTSAQTSDELVDLIVNSELPVVVDFWAPWCGACRMLDPVLAGLRTEYDGRVRFVRVDVDQHRGISAYFRVNSIPTVFMIESNTVRTMIPGVRDRQAYVSAINSLIDASKKR